MPKKKPQTKKTAAKGAKGPGILEQDPPIIVGGGGSTVICIPNNATERANAPSYVNDPGSYQKYYEVGWDTLSIYVKDGTGGNNKHKPKDKDKHYTAFSKNA
ncbi:MAG TPA: hypothetical protein VEM96_02380 [Pyrinomonadaceae bacterium]|nr:hypothetical protein [Pyrinomonadaceae bacterium]